MLHAYDIKKMCCLDGLKIRNSLASCYAPVPTRLVYLPVTYELLTEEKKVVVKSSKLVKNIPQCWRCNFDIKMSKFKVQYDKIAPY